MKGRLWVHSNRGGDGVRGHCCQLPFKGVPELEPSPLDERPLLWVRMFLESASCLQEQKEVHRH
jgi:hypothetical protein